MDRMIATHTAWNLKPNHFFHLETWNPIIFFTLADISLLIRPPCTLSGWDCRATTPYFLRISAASFDQQGDEVLVASHSSGNVTDIIDALVDDLVSSSQLWCVWEKDDARGWDCWWGADIDIIFALWLQLLLCSCFDVVENALLDNGLWNRSMREVDTFILLSTTYHYHCLWKSTPIRLILLRVYCDVRKGPFSNKHECLLLLRTRFMCTKRRYWMILYINIPYYSSLVKMRFPR